MKCTKGKGKGKKNAPPPSSSLSPAISSDDERPDPPPQPFQSATEPEQPEYNLESPSQEDTPEDGHRRARKKSCRLRDEQQEGEVLEWVEENPLLWNSKHKEFKIKHKKDRMWAKKAEELGYDDKLL